MPANAGAGRVFVDQYLLQTVFRNTGKFGGAFP
jgi:hypothetical protein